MLPGYSGVEHSFLLQGIHDLQGKVGHLLAKVDAQAARLEESLGSLQRTIDGDRAKALASAEVTRTASETLKTELATVSKWQSMIIGGAIVAAFFVATLAALAAWAINSSGVRLYVQTQTTDLSHQQGVPAAAPQKAASR
jgi:hypothetical protein